MSHGRFFVVYRVCMAMESENHNAVLDELRSIGDVFNRLDHRRRCCRGLELQQ